MVENNKSTTAKKTTTPAKKKPTLGRGLEEIFGGDVQQIINNIESTRTSGETQKVDITKLLPNPYQPRKQFDEEEINGLAQSIKENGLFTPILVKSSPGGKYYIVAGERRTRASKIAGLKEIPVIVADLSDDEMQRIALVENVQRSELNPIEVALSVKSMMDKQKLTQDDISKIIGKSRSYVANLIGLLKLDEKVINGVISGKISYGHARPLISLENTNALDIYQKIIENNLSVREVEGYANAAKLREARKNKKPLPKLKTKSNEVLYAEELLRSKVKSKVDITSNEIRIKYRGEEQLSRILERLDVLEE